ncbi:MAG: hypothetical protein QOF51_2113 [Chloroflexota bacterium]|jgi:phenylpyruvate tautomerase PptA (4-oxalocrotonate tautomerase family)|nr:hypothetical protein [Chloroflexota bacterium]
MIFAEFYGPASTFAETLSTIEERIASVMNARPEDVVVRRVEAESDYPGAEIWIELSSEEQLARHGRELARQVTSAIRGQVESDVWVLFRVVPLDRVYLNGEPRRRGLAGLD